jgi:hypothetical protein
MENNPFNNSEKAPVVRQEVVNRLKDYGIEDSTTKNLHNAWVDQIHSTAENITDLKERLRVEIENEITIAELYIETGYLNEAWDNLNETIDQAVNAGQRELLNKINGLLDQIEEN